MSRIAFVIPYLGAWPSWSRLFFLGVDNNRFVDFIILCEEAPFFRVPDNVCVMAISRNDLVLRINMATGLSLTSITGHKLCDFRPFFGLIFSDLLEGYEFWGYCDIDMMFGDLSKLLDRGFLDSIDVFSAHDKQIVGHFTLIRNSNTLNHACFSIQNWEERCSKPANTSLDELPFGAALNVLPGVRFSKPNSLAVELSAAFCKFGLTFDYAGAIAGLDQQTPMIAEWRNGATYLLFQTGPDKEVLYIHFMGNKRGWHWMFFDADSAKNSIHRFSRIGYGGVITVKDLSLSHWGFFFWIQQLLQNSKSGAGSIARKLMPENMFLKLRRRLFGKGRY